VYAIFAIHGQLAGEDMFTAEIIIEATSKELNFLSDPDLADIIRSILLEIDNLAGVRAHRSMLYLSMSTLEGILSNVLNLNKNKIKAFKSYPKTKKGTLKNLKSLTLSEKINISKDLGIISSEFSGISDKLRDYRNYMHPQVELEKKQPLDLGLAQVALGLMNHTIAKLEKQRFIDEKIWSVISGVPIYISNQNIIDFKLHYPIPTHSFMVTTDYSKNDIQIDFELNIETHAIFNFVFNYDNEIDFYMLRFETRKNESCAILRCKKKYAWHFIEKHKSKWNIKTDESNKVSVRIKSGYLKIFINDKEESFSGTISCDNKKGIGFFNEVKDASINNLSVKII
jgi:hypothetical protein